MAISFVRVTQIQRSKGHSAAAALAYETGQSLNRLDGESVDYRNRGGVENEAHIFGTSLGMQELADKMELAERRRNSCVGRRYIMALPHELSEAGRQKVALQFAEHLHQKYGVAGVVTVHKPTGEGDERNHHAHLTMTDRRINAEGELGEKVEELTAYKTRNKETQSIKEKWAEICNEQLQAEKVEEKLDFTSYHESGKESQLHQGKRRTEVSRKAEKGKSYKIPKEKEQEIIDHISQNKDTQKRLLCGEESENNKCFALSQEARKKLKGILQEKQEERRKLPSFVASFDRSETFKKVLEKEEFKRLTRLNTSYKSYEGELTSITHRNNGYSANEMSYHLDKFFQRVEGGSVKDSIELAELTEKYELKQQQEKANVQQEREGGNSAVEKPTGNRQAGKQQARNAGARPRERENQVEARERAFREAFGEIRGILGELREEIQSIRREVPEAVRRGIKAEKAEERRTNERVTLLNSLKTKEQREKLVENVAETLDSIKQQFSREKLSYTVALSKVKDIAKQCGKTFGSLVDHQASNLMEGIYNGKALAKLWVPKSQQEKQEEAQKKAQRQQEKQDRGGFSL